MADDKKPQTLDEALMDKFVAVGVRASGVGCEMHVGTYKGQMQSADHVLGSITVIALENCIVFCRGNITWAKGTPQEATFYRCPKDYVNIADISSISESDPKVWGVQ